MVLHTSLLNIQQYKVCIEGKVEQSREKSENEKIDKYVDLAWELKKTVEHDGDGDTNCN